MKGNIFFVETGIERVALKARNEKNLQFTSLIHHVTVKEVFRNLKQIPKSSSSGVDGISRDECIDEFLKNHKSIINSMHKMSYKAPPVRRVYIPKPGKTEKRPIGVPTIMDRAIQGTIAEVLSKIYEEDFLNCSFGGRPNKSAHNALCTLQNYILAKKINWVFEAARLQRREPPFLASINPPAFTVGENDIK